MCFRKIFHTVFVVFAQLSAEHLRRFGEENLLDGIAGSTGAVAVTEFFPRDQTSLK